MPPTEIIEEFSLVRDFAIIMTVAGVAVVIFSRLNQPSILGYLVAGLLVGPFTLAKPPVTNIESIRLLADLGLVLLLFAVGLEFGWRRIRQVGLGVLLIGSVEILVSISLGYQVGRLLGWTALESIFLGSALCISSSAILIKVLRDTGMLTTAPGRLIVGILVLEDFVAVILLTFLSGIAATGTADIGDIGPLVAKLAIFGVSSLALGAIVVPRIIGFVAQFHSRETMLLTSLALCFLLALIAQSLEVSAAAGAFLIGAVIGDTEHSKQVTRIISPVRDMFAALFFVSIGMLIDISVIMDYLVPSLVISIVFIAGKIAANTMGTFVAGRPGRTPIQVGMGMPQMGEFSLAMMKVGVEHNAIGVFMYQVVAAVTAITSLVYPYIVRSTERVADLIERSAPFTVRRFVSNLSVELQGLRAALSFDTSFAHRVRGSSLAILINFMIIMVLVGIGTFGVGRAPMIASLISVQEGIVGSAIGFATLALCFPSAVAIWRSLQSLADETTAHLILRRRASRVWVQETLRNVIRDSVMIFIIFLIGLWSVPFVSELLSLGGVAIPVPLVVLAALVYIAVRSGLHGHLVEAFSRPFLGDPEESAPQDASPPRIPESPDRDAGGQPNAPASVVPRDPDSVVRDHERVRPSVSLSEAEIIALSTVSGDRSPYRARLGSREIVWDIRGAKQSQGYYRITLSFRTADAPDTNVGEEELYLDLAGQVRLRQITSWPAGTSRRLPLALLYLGAVVLVAASVGAGVFAFAQNRSEGLAGATIHTPREGTGSSATSEPPGSQPLAPSPVDRLTATTAIGTQSASFSAPVWCGPPFLSGCCGYSRP